MKCILLNSCRASHSDHSGSGPSRRERNNEAVDIDAVEVYAIYESLDRPPTYTEACSAPPLYGAPLNRVRDPYSTVSSETRV